MKCNLTPSLTLLFGQHKGVLFQHAEHSKLHQFLIHFTKLVLDGAGKILYYSLIVI